MRGRTGRKAADVAMVDARPSAAWASSAAVPPSAGRMARSCLYLSSHALGARMAMAARVECVRHRSAWEATAGGRWPAWRCLGARCLITSALCPMAECPLDVLCLRDVPCHTEVV